MLLLILLHLHLITLPSMLHSIRPCQNSCAWISWLVVAARAGKIAGDGLTFAGRRLSSLADTGCSLVFDTASSCVCVFALPPTERSHSHRLSSHRVHPPLRPPRSGRRRGEENGLGGVGAGIREGGRDPNHRRVRPL